jgi:hypothetical protein
MPNRFIPILAKTAERRKGTTSQWNNMNELIKTLYLFFRLALNDDQFFH